MSKTTVLVKGIDIWYQRHMYGGIDNGLMGKIYTVVVQGWMYM